ncbi:glycosyltransferase family 4 protein [Lactobacillus delbrueckii]|uniref:glycosyltransferase family 4 protein n=1 Tax=Lactobacillus delbrueckii TaxID=1584 RepID=UPI001F227F2B|nr:glycosyltransferase family 4 protein [Lactobacillus delbrueckii]GHN29300.1 glycosyl transferase [Lactobacillus delbrueckii]
MANNKQQMTIGYLSPTNPFTDRKGWSGTYFSTRQAIEDAGFKVEWVPSEETGTFFKIEHRVLKMVHCLIYGRGIFDNSTMSSKLRVRYANKQNLDKYDLIFVPGQSDVVARLRTKTPIIRYSDATVALMIDYYWFNWSKKSIDDANNVEQMAIDNSAVNLLSSQWAASSVINDYHASKDRVFVLPFGANIDDSKIVQAQVYQSGRLNVFFTGVDWERKGGEIAVNAIKKLRSDGVDAHLYICGISDLAQEIVDLDFVENLGFLDKNNPNEYQKYLNTWSKVHLLLLPTRAECSAIVFNEASAYGVPILSTDTGGVSDYVFNDVNGWRMPLSASGDDYAIKIEEWIKTDKFSDLSASALNLYQTRNSWKAWGESFKKIVSSL